jgi:hypothetical protein
MRWTSWTSGEELDDRPFVGDPDTTDKGIVGEADDTQVGDGRAVRRLGPDRHDRDEHKHSSGPQHSRSAVAPRRRRGSIPVSGLDVVIQHAVWLYSVPTGFQLGSIRRITGFVL